MLVDKKEVAFLWVEKKWAFQKAKQLLKCLQTFEKSATASVIFFLCILPAFTINKRD